MKLTHHNLGQALRTCIYADHATAADAARSIDADEFDLRRAWGHGNQASRHLSLARLCEYFERLGYEVHFTVEKSVAHNQVVQATDKRDIARLGS